MVSNVSSYFIDREAEECWDIYLDGYFKSCITEQLLKDDMPEDAVNTIFQNSVDTLIHCPNPKNKNPNGKTGIIIGRVQSGKTSNFLSLVALAFDNDYDITVVLGGNTKNLVEQNYDRIRDIFSKAADAGKVAILSTSNSNLLKPKIIKKLLDDGKKVILVGLKHHKHIKQIAEIFDDADLSNRLTLIIDDEGDQATFNTIPTKKQQEEKKKKDSATYSAVRTLTTSLKRHCLLSVTATPQANILVDKIDFLSPDFGTLVYPGDGYCGLNEFHGEDSEKYVKIIPDDDYAILLEDNIVPHSLKKALATFFVSGAIRQYRDDDKKFKHSMLIHPDVSTGVHGAILSIVEDLIDNDWRIRAEAKEYGGDLYSPLKRYLEEAYSEYLEDGVQLPPFDVLEDRMLLGIKNSCLHLCNSELNASADAEHFMFNIFVGGNMLGRGITLPKLTVTYITRRAKGVANVDNTEQRARWFGYRNADKPYFDVCRVYATKNISNDFSAILEHEEDLWQTIERSKADGVEFKEITRLFKLPSKLLSPTRRSVAQTEFLRFSSMAHQTHLSSSPSIANENDQLISEFRSLHPPKVYDLGYHMDNPHLIIPNLNFYDVCKEFLEKYKYPRESPLNQEYIQLLSSLLKKSENEIGTPLIDVIWMRPNIGSARKIRDDGAISQLFIGASKFYPGDRYLPETGNIQLQIHYIRPNNYPQSQDIKSDIGLPVLALRLPVSYSMAIDRKYVVRKGENL